MHTYIHTYENFECPGTSTLRPNRDLLRKCNFLTFRLVSHLYTAHQEHNERTRDKRKKNSAVYGLRTTN